MLATAVRLALPGRPGITAGDTQNLKNQAGRLQATYGKLPTLGSPAMVFFAFSFSAIKFPVELLRITNPTQIGLQTFRNLF